MIVEKIERNGMLGKIYRTKDGYNYKIFKDKDVIMMSYVYLLDIDVCRSKLIDDLDNIDLDKVDKL